MSADTQVASSSTAAPSEAKEIVVNSAAEFVAKLAQLDRKKGTETFYRGHADKDWKLIPSILRTLDGPWVEDELFREMVAHEPQSFSECRSTLDHLVQMQHYGLPTRLLDVTMNPLVALYFACEETTPDLVDGLVYQFVVPEWKVKSYDSDTVSVLANLAKCKWNDIRLTLYPKLDMKGSFYDTLLNLLPIEVLRKDMLHETVYLGISMFGHWREVGFFPDVHTIKNEGLAKILSSGEPISEELFTSRNPYQGTGLWVDELWQGILGNGSSFHEETEYLEWLNKQKGLHILLHQIRSEKPHFLPLIQPQNLVNMFFVKAKYDNQRITNQSGAFLLFGLGLVLSSHDDMGWEVLYCDKRKVATVPDDWIKRKFLIPKDKKETIRKELANLGITDSYIYPGIEQYAKELKQRYGL